MLSSSWDGRMFGHNRHGPKIGGLCPFLGGAGSPSNTMWHGPTPVSISSGILVHPSVWQQYMSQKLGAAMPPFWGGELGPRLTQCCLGQGLTPYQPHHHNRFTALFLGPPGWASAKWYLNPSSRLATTDMGQKLWEGGLCPFLGGKLGPHLTQCGQGQGLPPCQISSWSIQPFGYTNVTDRQDGTDRKTIQ